MVPWFTLIKSILPSPFTSAAQTETGMLPEAFVETGTKVGIQKVCACAHRGAASTNKAVDKQRMLAFVKMVLMFNKLELI